MHREEPVAVGLAGDLDEVRRQIGGRVLAQEHAAAVVGVDALLEEVLLPGVGNGVRSAAAVGAGGPEDQRLFRGAEALGDAAEVPVVRHRVEAEEEAWANGRDRGPHGAGLVADAFLEARLVVLGQALGLEPGQAFAGSQCGGLAGAARGLQEAIPAVVAEAGLGEVDLAAEA